MILIGELALWVALLMATWAAAVSFAGGAQGRTDLITSGERGIYAALAMLTLASLGIWTALATHDTSVEHVARFTSANLPLVYTLSALWIGAAGSLLLWALLLAACSATAVRTGRDRIGALGPYVTGTLAVILSLALAALCLGANPYGQLDFISSSGMHPVLQHPAMALHPPSLYLGLASTAVPFALAIAALVTGKPDDDWVIALSRWVLASWTFLTVGVLLGMWWGYAEPDWSGHWARDSLANAALFPWLINTVLLASLVRGETPGYTRRRHIILPLLAFPLALFSAFVARGGMIGLASFFGRSPLAQWTTGFLVLAGAACVYLAATRLAHLPRDAAAASSRGSESWWRMSRSPRPGGVGLRVVEVGIVVVLLALAAQVLGTRHVITLNAGASVELRDAFGRQWRFTSQGVSQYNELNRRVVAAGLEATREGRTMGIVTSERRQYVDSRGAQTFEPFTVAGKLGSLTQDVRVSLYGVGADERVRIRISFFPLIAWVWIGGLIMSLGGAILLAGSIRGSGR